MKPSPEFEQNSLIASTCQSNQGQVSALNSQVHVIFIESGKFRIAAKEIDLQISELLRDWYS